MSVGAIIALSALALPLVVFFIAVAVAVAASEDPCGNWDVRAHCPCGWVARAPFGTKFHIHHECCPSCGSDKDAWVLKTSRRVNRQWEYRP